MDTAKLIKKRITEQLPEVKKNAALLYSLGRSLSYVSEQWALPWIDFLVTRHRVPYTNVQKGKIPVAYAKLYDILRQDAENMANGVYPYSVLKIENPYRHMKSLMNVFSDAIKISKRRQQHQSHDFDHTRDNEDFASAPDYSKRNFHYQTNGYFSDESAELYDHQVEILFAGSSHAMRRMLVGLIKKEIPNQGEGLHFLELGCGTGILTRFMKLAFPKAKITASDMSSSYLKKAQRDLADLSGISYVQSHAESLPFKDNTFDLVYSCYLFHELPLPTRKATLDESQRVLKQSGLWGFVDSLQNNDDKDMQWALDQFPVDFHEPFYKNYIQNSIETMLENTEMSIIGTTIGFLSKAILAKKILESPKIV
ncbi:MAG: class I SAM-dependent methyltransferase [Bdellovibrionaceae bacterium]|nr:class I SAM-dependent methyltransferase [Pseudobdellovibrionaceae bacterium]